MTTDTILNMCYMAKISVGDNVVTETCDVESVAQVLRELLGPTLSVKNGHVQGSIEVPGRDLESIHSTLEAGQSVDIRVGIARNKTLAEIALLWSDRSGITHIALADEDTYLAGIPVAEIAGLSAASTRQMRKFQIYTAYDLKHSNQQFIETNFNDEISRLYLSYNSTQSEMSPAWYKQISVKKVAGYIGEVFSSEAADTKRSYKLVQRSNEPGAVPNMLSLFDYQHATRKPL